MQTDESKSLNSELDPVYVCVEFQEMQSYISPECLKKLTGRKAQKDWISWNGKNSLMMQVKSEGEQWHKLTNC